HRARRTWASGFTIPTAIAGNFPCKMHDELAVEHWKDGCRVRCRSGALFAEHRNALRTAHTTASVRWRCALRLNYMTPITQAYAVQSADSPFALFSFTRREVLPPDVKIDILFCGRCHSDIHT